MPERALGAAIARTPPWVATAALAVLWLVSGPATPDLAAQVHRVDLFHARGFAVWDGAWYAGHHVPGYSLTFPALGALVGVRLAGALAAVASAALFGALAGRARPAARWWFAAACLGDLVVGRLTYALGVTVGLAAVLALVRGRPVVACGLAAVCSATSPVAGSFLALVGVALAAEGDRPWPPRPAPLAVAGTALGTAGALAIAFPEGGDQPFATGAFVVALAVTLAAAAVGRGWIRRSVLLYAAAMIACEVVASPMGSNVTRLGAAFLAPVLLLAAGPSRGARRAALAATLVAAATWQWVDPLTQATRAWGDRPPPPRTPPRSSRACVPSRPGAASRSRSPGVTGRPCPLRPPSRWPAAGSASSIAVVTGCSTRRASTPPPTAAGWRPTRSPRSPSRTPRWTPPAGRKPRSSHDIPPSCDRSGTTRTGSSSTFAARPRWPRAAPGPASSLTASP